MGGRRRRSPALGPRLAAVVWGLLPTRTSHRLTASPQHTRRDTSRWGDRKDKPASWQSRGSAWRWNPGCTNQHSSMFQALFRALCTGPVCGAGTDTSPTSQATGLRGGPPTGTIQLTPVLFQGVERVKPGPSHTLWLSPKPPAWPPAAPWKLQVEKQLWFWPRAAGGARSSLLCALRPCCCLTACRIDPEGPAGGGGAAAEGRWEPTLPRSGVRDVVGSPGVWSGGPPPPPTPANSAGGWNNGGVFTRHTRVCQQCPLGDAVGGSPAPCPSLLAR